MNLSILCQLLVVHFGMVSEDSKMGFLVEVVVRALIIIILLALTVVCAVVAVLGIFGLIEFFHYWYILLF